MSFSRNRNSRDDSPKRSRNNKDGFNSRSNDRPKSKFSDKDNSSFSKDKRSFDSKDRFGSKDSERKDNPSFSRDRSERNRSIDSKDRFGAKDSERKDNPPFSRDRSERNRSFGNKDQQGSRDFDRKDNFKGKRDFSTRTDEKGKSEFSSDRRSSGSRVDKTRSFGDQDRSFSRSGDKRSDGFKEKRTFSKYGEQSEEKSNYRNRSFSKPKTQAGGEPKNDGLIRLNRYISNSGVCSRRKADELIEAGVISVNGEVVTELGTKVDPAKDDVRYNNERLKREKMVYVLLNKPKDYITTTDDPQERKTVMHLVSKATRERIYPIGRLDRNTTGLLLLTNDGNLAEKLAHPRNNISKIYNVELDKNLTQGDFNKIEAGIELEDGFIKADDLSYVVGASKREIGIQIHSGKNRIVRRIFEHLGYDVIKLDRVVYANLTKKDLPRGRWRYLEERELIQLKHLIK